MAKCLGRIRRNVPPEKRSNPNVLRSGHEGCGLLPLFPIAAALIFAGLPASALEQEEAARAGAIAERELAEQRYKRLSSTVEDLLEAQASLQKRLNLLVEENRQLREDLLRISQSQVSREEIKRLAEALQEANRKWEEKREKDKKLILEEIKNLHLNPPAVVPTQPPGLTPAGRSSTPFTAGYEHLVQEKENLSKILQAYRDQGVKVTLKQFQDANPGINPNKIVPGQKIFIPDAGKQPVER